MQSNKRGSLVNFHVYFPLSLSFGDCENVEYEYRNQTYWMYDP